MKPAITRLSPKGQIVIPEEVRNNLGVQPGPQFEVVIEQNGILLKPIAKSFLEKFDHLVKQAQIQARQIGLKKTDIKAFIKKAREQK